MVHELQNAPKLELTDPGFISAFCVYPFAQSYAYVTLLLLLRYAATIC